MSESKIKIAPSVLAADFGRLGEEVAEVEKFAAVAGVDRLHIDVMDGMFVPNISFGVPVIKALAKRTKLPLETHLMIEAPERYLEAFVEAGSTTLLVHLEGANHLHRTIQQIKKLGVKAGVVLNPATPAAALEEILPDVDLVLLMTVNPGFGGQEFIRSTLPKIERVRLMIHDLNIGCELEVDGGIDPATAPLAVSAGATVLVAGSAIFGKSQGIEAALRQLAESAQV
ncbi:MAG: ribulose-phosphate 3-epimerase [Planctomycetia bacterium]|nr:ribulose-phosphate 3-epimerase [Planctomycetia bacterium]